MIIAFCLRRFASRRLYPKSEHFFAICNLIEQSFGPAPTAANLTSRILEAELTPEYAASLGPALIIAGIAIGTTISAARITGVIVQAASLDRPINVDTFWGQYYSTVM